MQMWLLALLLVLVVQLSAQPAVAMAPPDLPAEPAGRPIYIQPSPLASLIERAPGMAADARLDLAAIIVEALAGAYESELAVAMQEFERRGTAGRDISRWYLATAPILSELRARQAELQVANMVELHMEAHNQVLLMIDGRPLWVAWPRPAAQGTLERELASEFCRRRECPETSEAGLPARVAEPSAVEGHWTLTQYGPPTWESADGVNCEFAEFSRIGEKASSCQALVADLHLLAAALRAALHNGERVAWPHVGLRAASGGQQYISVNEHGDYILVLAPSLAASQVDWEEARRWLEARVQGRAARATVLRARGG
jgi:hypothetical protein